MFDKVGRNVLSKVVSNPAWMRRKLEDPATRLKLAMSNPKIIKSRRQQLDYYKLERYDRRKPLTQLTSAAWHKSLKNGDYFSILPFKRKTSMFSVATFQDTGLDPRIWEVLSSNGFKKVTDIQHRVIGQIIQNEKHFAIGATTGSGKTLAYILPVIQKIINSQLETIEAENKLSNPQAVILLPTSELCHQVLDVCKLFKDLVSSFHLHNHMTPVEFTTYNSKNYDIIVSSPSAILGHLKRRNLSLSGAQFLVIDETDTLLDDSFAPLIRNILSKVIFSSGERVLCQLIMVGATLSNDIGPITDLTTGDVGLEVIKGSALHKPQFHVKHNFYRMAPTKVKLAVVHLLKDLIRKPGAVLIFCNSYRSVYELSKFFEIEKISHQKIQPNLELSEREDLIKLLRDGLIKVLITTDLLSRGIDTQNVCHVINYDFPLHLSDYIHRAGRVGRIGQPVRGQVTSYVSRPYHAPIVQEIERSVRMKRELDDVDANIQRKYKEHSEKEENEANYSGGKPRPSS